MTAQLDDFLAEVQPHAYGWPESLRFTYDTTRQLLAGGVPGALVECGVAAGAHPAVMVRACIDEDVPRFVHLFDSFRGVPNGGEYDLEWNREWGDGSGSLKATGVSAHTRSDVEANLIRWVGGGIDLCLFHEGWFQETLAAFGGYIGPIAFLRLDGDLYESTLVCLEHLYPLLSPGGVLVVDDTNLDGCRRACGEYFHGIGAEDQMWTTITASGDAWTRKP